MINKFKLIRILVSLHYTQNFTLALKGPGIFTAFQVGADFKIQITFKPVVNMYMASFETEQNYPYNYNR